MGDFGYILGFFGFFCFCIGALIGWFSAKKEKKRIMNNLKELICSGTVVKFRDGRLAVAISSIDPEEGPTTYTFYGLDELLSCVNRNGITRLDAYNDNMDDKVGGILSSYDIMAISYDAFSFKDLIRIMFGFMSEEDICWDWKREDVIEVTMEAVEEKFGCKVKIVKEED